MHPQKLQDVAGVSEMSSSLPTCLCHFFRSIFNWTGVVMARCCHGLWAAAQKVAKGMCLSETLHWHSRYDNKISATNDDYHDIHCFTYMLHLLIIFCCGDIYCICTYICTSIYIYAVHPPYLHSSSSLPLSLLCANMSQKYVIYSNI